MNLQLYNFTEWDFEKERSFASNYLNFSFNFVSV